MYFVVINTRLRELRRTSPVLVHSSSSSSSSFFFNRPCNPCGFWPAQLSLSILSRKVFTECRLPAARQTPNFGEPVIKTFQLSPQGVPSVWNDASELWARNCREFCRKWRLPRHFWVLLHTVNYDMGATALLPLRRKVRWGFFSPEKSDGFGRVWTRELGYRSRYLAHSNWAILKQVVKILFLYVQKYNLLMQSVL